MKKVNQSFMLCILLILCISDQTVVFASRSMDEKAVKGIIDLSTINEQEMVALSGEWEFYWRQFLEPGDFNNQTQKPNYMKVPSLWKGHMIENKPIGSTGYATYRLKIHINPNDIGKEKVLLVDEVSSAYKVWIDGKEKKGKGQIGKDRSAEIPQIQINSLYFTPKNETIEIVIQVSNFSYRKGGITANIFYGDPANIAQTPVIKEEIQSIFIIGGLLSIGIYNLLIFAFTKKQLDLLYTSLASFALAIRTVILNKYLVIYLFPDLSWILLKKAEYIIELVIFLFIVLMIRHLYQQEIQGTMVKVTYIYVFVCIVYFILAPPLLITKTAMFHIPIIALILGYFLFYVTIMAFLNKREGAKITFIGLILLLFGIVHDTLLSIGWIDTFPIVDSCILIYFILKGVVISYRFSALFQQNNALNMKLVNINEQLEETIASRTKELQEKNKELEEANKKLSILSTTDGLTGLANRRQLDHLLETEIAKAASCQYPLAVMVIDVDYFKKFNDTYGHLHGDDCLKLVSEVLKNHSNDQDILSARYGGEEFVVIVRNKTEDLVHFLAEQIRRSVENLQEKHIGSPHKIVTISIGVAIGIPAADTSSEQFLEAADHALYQVKEQGRNGVILLPIQKVAQKTLS